jgi:cysteine desulfurase
MKIIDLDSNATTPLLPAAWEAMQPYLFDRSGNPASTHSLGRQARKALEDARERIADLLGAQPEEVIFTSGATEANNLAVFGLIDPRHPGRILTSLLEHPSVLEPIRQLTGHGFTFEHMSVTPTGNVAVPLLVEGHQLRLIACMLANHETGAVQGMKFAHESPFHCDAAAGAGKMPISFRQLQVSTLTISAHKFHGPKGIGALLVKRNVKLRPLLWGGHQQHGKRPGTEPVALVVGMAEALAWSLQNLDAHRAHLLALRRRFLDHLSRHAAPVLLNGPDHGGLPHALNLSFPGCQADALVMSLDLAGIACSTGSACSSGSLLPSPVLIAMGKADDALHSAIRFSLSPLQTAEDVDEAARRIVRCVQQLRQAHVDDD